MDHQNTPDSVVLGASAAERESQSDEGSIEEVFYRAQEDVRPYQFEPEYDESDSSSASEDDEPGDLQRLGNTEW